MSRYINGLLVIREGKCIDCDARISVLSDGTRTACDCVPKMLTREQRAQKDWMEKTFSPKKGRTNVNL